MNDTTATTSISLEERPIIDLSPIDMAAPRPCLLVTVVPGHSLVSLILAGAARGPGAVVIGFTPVDNISTLEPQVVPEFKVMCDKHVHAASIVTSNAYELRKCIARRYRCISLGHTFYCYLAPTQLERLITTFAFIDMPVMRLLRRPMGPISLRRRIGVEDSSRRRIGVEDSSRRRIGVEDSSRRRIGVDTTHRYILYPRTAPLGSADVDRNLISLESPVWEAYRWIVDRSDTSLDTLEAAVTATYNDYSTHMWTKNAEPYWLAREDFEALHHLALRRELTAIAWLEGSSTW